MTLGRIGIARISVLARKIELIARLMTPVSPVRRASQALAARRHTVASPEGNNDVTGEESEKGPLSPAVRSVSSFGDKQLSPRRDSDPGPKRPWPAVISTKSTRSTSDSPSSPIEQLHISPIHSSLNFASTAALKPEKLRKHKEMHKEIDLSKELPHSLHTSAVVAGAVGIHIPKRFKSLLRARNWEQLVVGNNLREISTEYTREPSSDPAFEVLSQFTLPPTALLLDPTFRVYPESMFREAVAGLLQIGFGLYQLVSDDAKMSVEKDGLASPYLLVLPYLGMAIVNIIVNVLDPPYSVITVLDISKPAREALMENYDLSSDLSPISSLGASEFFSSQIPRETSSTSLLGRKAFGGMKEPSVIWEDKESDFTRPEDISKFFSDGHGTWSELMQWVEFAYGTRIDICPVDRLFQTPWLSHALVIGEFVWSAFSALLVPAVLLATIGAWTHFKTSTFGYSLAFNILAIFALPFLQFVLCTCYLFSRVHRDLKGRREHGTSYWEPAVEVHHVDTTPHILVRWLTGHVKKRSKWWDVVARSLGLAFPVRKTVISVFVFLVVGIATVEFVLVGFNLMRTLNCDMALLMKA